MTEPKFISREVLAQLHEDSIAQFGGTLGVRDESMVLSSLGAADNAHYYGYGDLFDVAAALLFLRANNVQGHPDQMGLYEGMIAIAERRLDKAGLAALFRQLFAWAKNGIAKHGGVRILRRLSLYVSHDPLQQPPQGKHRPNRHPRRMGEFAPRPRRRHFH